MKELSKLSAWGKKASLIVLASGLALSSCSKKSDAPVPEPVKPEVVAQEKVLATLTAPANGWEAAIYPSANQRFGGYTAFVRFTKDKALEAVNELQETDALSKSTFELSTSATTTSATTSLKMVANAAMRLSEQDALSAHTGEDYDIETISSEEVKLVGKGNGTVIVLRPATADAWATQVAKVKASRTDKLVTRFKVADGTTVIATGNINDDRHIIFTEKGQSQGYPFRYTTDGIELFAPVTLGGKALQRLVSNGSLDEPEYAAKESTLTLKAQANDLVEYLRSGAYEIVLANTQGRSNVAVKSITTRMSKLAITFKSVTFGTKDKTFGVHVSAERKNFLGKIDKIEFTIPFILEVQALNKVKLTFNAQLIQEGGSDPTMDSQLYTYTFGNTHRMDTFAACFSNVGTIPIAGTKPKNLFTDPNFNGRVFKVTADNPFNPTKLTLTDQSEDAKETPNVITFDLTK